MNFFSRFWLLRLQTRANDPAKKKAKSIVGNNMLEALPVVYQRNQEIGEFVRAELIAVERHMDIIMRHQGGRRRRPCLRAAGARHDGGPVPEGRAGSRRGGALGFANLRQFRRRFEAATGARRCVRSW